MTQYEIVEMAEQAGFDPHDMSSDFTCNLQNINAFAKLVAEKAIKEALAPQAVVEQDLAAAYRTELDKLSQRNYELRMENAQLKAQPKEPEQEPVGSLSVRYHRGCKSMTNTDFDYNGDLPEGDYELYTTPPQRKPLTEEQMDAMIDGCPKYHGRFSTKDPDGKLNYYELIRAIEAAHGIKE